MFDVVSLLSIVSLTTDSYHSQDIDLSILMIVVKTNNHQNYSTQNTIRKTTVSISLCNLTNLFSTIAHNSSVNEELNKLSKGQDYINYKLRFGVWIFMCIRCSRILL